MIRLISSSIIKKGKINITESTCFKSLIRDLSGLIALRYRNWWGVVRRVGQSNGGVLATLGRFWLLRSEH